MDQFHNIHSDVSMLFFTVDQDCAGEFHFIHQKVFTWIPGWTDFLNQVIL